MAFGTRVGTRSNPSSPSGGEDRKGPEYRVAPPRRSIAPKRLAIVAAALSCGLVAFVATRGLSPRIGQASEAQILAVIPGELRQTFPIGGTAVARFKGLRDLILDEFGGGDEPSATTDGVGATRAAFFSDLKRRLGEGPLQAPVESDPMRDSGSFQRVGQALCLALSQAKDDVERFRYAALSLRFLNALEMAGREGADGATIGGLGQAIEDALLMAESRGAFDEAQRRRLVAMLPSPEEDERARKTILLRHFQESILPRIVSASRSEKEFWRSWRGRRFGGRVGSFDPLETAHLMATIAKLQLGGDVSGSQRVAADLAKSLPDRTFVDWRGTDFESRLSRLQWSAAMNNARNTFGRQWASRFGFYDATRELRFVHEILRTRLGRSAPDQILRTTIPW